MTSLPRTARTEGAAASSSVTTKETATLPPATTPKEREFYQTMAQELAFNPRQNLGV